MIAGVNIVEEDPNDTSVGYGGLPNEEGEVELDASVMDGLTCRCGAVGALKNIKTPSRVARLVMERTDHIFLVGEGALKFALKMGFQKEDLLTETSRRKWLEWRSKLSATDNWLSEEFDGTRVRRGHQALRDDQLPGPRQQRQPGRYHDHQRAFLEDPRPRRRLADHRRRVLCGQRGRRRGLNRARRGQH